MKQHGEDGEYSRRQSQPVATPGLKDVPGNHPVAGFTEQRARGEADLRAACSVRRGKGPNANGLRQSLGAASTKASVRESLASWAGACLFASFFFFFLKAVLR